MYMYLMYLFCVNNNNCINNPNNDNGNNNNTCINNPNNDNGNNNNYNTCNNYSNNNNKRRKIANYRN